MTDLAERLLARRQARRAVDPYRSKPAEWVATKLGEHLWSKQVEIVDAVRTHRKVAVKACHGPGKSYTAARVVGHWLDTHPHGEAFAVTSAPTDPQVKAILWREITRMAKKGNLPGRVTLDAQWKIDDQLVAYGRKPADHDEDGFQGIHDRYVLVVLDEACGIPKSLWTATDTLVTNDDARILAIGNPDHPLSEFAEICAGAPEDGTSGMSKLGWWVITISIFDTPNFTGEWIPEPLRAYLPSKVWLEERRQRWGEGSPLWLSKVLGLFPKDASDGVIPWSWLQNCRGEEATAKIGGLRVPVELGIDVAGSEDGDETVIAGRAGGRVLGVLHRMRTVDSEEIVDQALATILDQHATAVKVDVIGLGFGVVGSLKRRCVKEVPWPVKVHGVNVAEAATEPTRFVNLKAEIWWELGREFSRTGAWDLTDVDDETLLELSAPRYQEKNKRVQIESKAEVKKRIGRSTDNADAVLLACYVPTVKTVPPPKKYRDKRLKGRR